MSSFIAMPSPELKTVNFKRTFSAAHRIPSHHGKCKRIHGHNYAVDVDITTDTLNDMGMVVEWGTIKDIIDKMDHKLILVADDPLWSIFNNAATMGILPYDAEEWCYAVLAEPSTEVLADYLAGEFVKATRQENPGAEYIYAVVRLRETASIEATGTFTYMEVEEQMERDRVQSELNDIVGPYGMRAVQEVVQLP
jgi:6-pyruvoyltetrahydropterin/6-carboxytetrahydropterin synthase